MESEYVIVKNNDTLSSISRKCGIDWRDMVIERSGQSYDMSQGYSKLPGGLFPGDQVILPVKNIPHNCQTEGKITLTQLSVNQGSASNQGENAATAAQNALAQPVTGCVKCASTTAVIVIDPGHGGGEALKII